ncbi:MAG: 50S ribosomal protein L2 [Spirochaetes bacterium]|nr:50S ribosomal protein L2 [Spirochaetota bacterium]
MAIKYFLPVTPGLRGKAINDYRELTKKEPERSLIKGKQRQHGRDMYGHISARRHGGGHKRKYRMIDFRRDKYDMPALVKALEYDPNRTANLALLVYPDGEKRYILAPDGLKVGDTVVSGAQVKSQLGNCLLIENITAGSFIHNIELHPGRGGQMCRSAGTFAKLLGRDGNHVSIQLPSGEVRMVPGKCYATVGELGNKEWSNENWGKAGRTRWFGEKPRSRAVAMNPVDHPMGGGEGRSSGGRHPCSPKGKLAKGFKTRNKKKYSSHAIVRSRSKKR